MLSSVAQNKDVLNFPSLCRSLCCTGSMLFVYCFTLQNAAVAAVEAPSPGYRHEASEPPLSDDGTCRAYLRAIHFSPRGLGVQKQGRFLRMPEMACPLKAQFKSTLLHGGHEVRDWGLWKT